MTVLIPASGLGSRLGELTDHTNKTLVSVGNQAIITRIIQSYPEDTQFLVMLGHKGELVREYLTLAHPNLDVVYLDLEMREGNMGFVEALRRQRDLIPGPFVFHASDTLLEIPENFFTDPGNAVIGYKPSGDVSQYRTIRVAEGPNHSKFVGKIMEKGDPIRGDDLVHIGVVSFYKMDLFWEVVEGLDPNACDTHIVNAMTEKMRMPFHVDETTSWWDTGNISKLAEAREHFADPDVVLLEKIDQAVYIVGDRVIKFFAKPEMVSKRVTRAAIIGEAVPEILGSTEHFYAYKRAEGKLARDVMYPAQFLRFLDWCQRTIWSSRPHLGIHTDHAFEFYWDKTVARLKAFYEKTGIKDCTDTINGEVIPPLTEMLEHLDWSRIIPSLRLSTGFHGDLHFSNILVGENDTFKLLDWREGFGPTTDYGDVYYDLGKILHGLIVSHDLVDGNQFKINVQESGNSRVVTFDIMRHHRHVECEEMFTKWCILNDYDPQVVRLMTALIYLNIAVLHHHPYDRFLYFLGKRMIFDVMA